jgi:hypothetical protein
VERWEPPYLELVIEAIDESGPMALPALSVAHYGQQNDDLMREPEMYFEVGSAGGTHPHYGSDESSKNDIRCREPRLLSATSESV